MSLCLNGVGNRPLKHANVAVAVSLETADSWGWPLFSLYPYRDARGIMWVPQQLWRFRKMLFGIWTICLHVNRWDSTEP